MFWIDLSDDEYEQENASRCKRRSEAGKSTPGMKVPTEARPRPLCTFWTCLRRAEEPCENCGDEFCRFHLGQCGTCGRRPLCMDCIYPAGHPCLDSDSEEESSHIAVISAGAINLGPEGSFTRPMVVLEPDGTKGERTTEEGVNMTAVIYQNLGLLQEMHVDSIN